MDLTKKVIGVEGQPESENPSHRIAVFDKPVDVSFTQQGKKKEKKFEAGVEEFKPLTFRSLFFRAVRQAGEGDGVPNIDKRTELMMKLVADKPELDVEQAGEIIKCVRALKDPLYLMRTKELFADLLPEKKKGKKK